MLIIFNELKNHWSKKIIFQYDKYFYLLKKLINYMPANKKTPNLFIVGAQKSGTTSLHNYLNEHPEIFMSKVKEPTFFSKFPGSPQIGKNISEEQYYELFKEVTDEKIVGESSVSYLFDITSAKSIFEANSQAKIIILLRDPVDRTFSHFLKPDNKMDFHQKILQDIGKIDLENQNYENIVSWSLYSNQVKRFLDIFGKQTKIIIFEEFFLDTRQQMKDIIKFLGLGNNVHEFSEEIYKKSYKPRNIIFQKIIKNVIVKKIGKKTLPSNFRDLVYAFLRGNDSKKNEITKEDEQILIDFFREDVSKLEKLLGRKLPWKSSVKK